MIGKVQEDILPRTLDLTIQILIRLLYIKVPHQTLLWEWVRLCRIRPQAHITVYLMQWGFIQVGSGHGMGTQRKANLMLI